MSIKNLMRETRMNSSREINNQFSLYKESFNLENIILSIHSVELNYHKSIPTWVDFAITLLYFVLIENVGLIYENL